MSPSKHAREAARARAERQAQRREAAARKRRNTQIGIAGTVVVILAIVGVIALAAGGDNKKDTITSTSPQTPAASPEASSTATTAPTGECSYPSSGRDASKDVGTPPAKPAGKQVTANVNTTVGDILFTMNGTLAPCTTNAFTYLAGKGYFNNTKCHRLTTSGIYVLQCGDPSGTGSGGPGFSYNDEALSTLPTDASGQTVYKAGTVAMANSGANTNGSQFFIVYKDSPLGPNYTPLGTVTAGINYIEKVGADGVEGGGTDGAPKDTVEIKTFTVK